MLVARFMFFPDTKIEFHVVKYGRESNQGIHSVSRKDISHTKKQYVSR